MISVAYWFKARMFVNSCVNESNARCDNVHRRVAALSLCFVRTIPHTFTMSSVSFCIAHWMYLLLLYTLYFELDIHTSYSLVRTVRSSAWTSDQLHRQQFNSNSHLAFRWMGCFIHLKFMKFRETRADWSRMIPHDPTRSHCISVIAVFI